MTRPRARVVAVCGDAGGAAAVAPVISFLSNDRRVNLDSFAYAQAGGVWTRTGVPFSAFPAESSTDALEAWLRNADASALLIGTSVNESMVEVGLTMAARKLAIPSLAILDFWSNYRRRFSRSDGTNIVLPSRIAIMDDQARREMLNEGFPNETLTITGQPAFDDISASVRTRKRHSGTGLSVLFVSQPLESFYGEKLGDMVYPGYSEKTVLPALILALDQLASSRKAAIRLLIQPHPREDADWMTSLRAEHLRIEVVRPPSPRDLLPTVDLVAGMNTVLLLEACYLGMLVVSLQPGLRGTDVLPASRDGSCPVVRRDEELKPMIEALLFDEATREGWQRAISKMRPSGGAARCVAELLYELLPIPAE